MRKRLEKWYAIFLGGVAAVCVIVVAVFDEGGKFCRFYHVSVSIGNFCRCDNTVNVRSEAVGIGFIVPGTYQVVSEVDTCNGDIIGFMRVIHIIKVRGG